MLTLEYGIYTSWLAVTCDWASVNQLPVGDVSAQVQP